VALKLSLQQAFSLIEILVVVAVIAVLTSLIIVSLFGTARQTSEIVARQQQAELQTALANWLTSASSEPGGLAKARSAYNSAPHKLLILSNYLQIDTYLRLTNSASEVRSSALTTCRATLQFSPLWTTENSPSIFWSNSQ
jgi:prepilin-type N-terminal cleavage/methylation domain-containing protein